MKRLTIFLLISVFLTACNFGTAPRPTKRINFECAETRLNSSFDFHDLAKKYYRSFYKTRKENELFYAWYASEDSIYMARSVKSCYDKKNKHFHAIRNLFQKNLTLQRLITQNMRQESQAEISELYLEEYRKIFVRDIQ